MFQKQCKTFLPKKNHKTKLSLKTYKNKTNNKKCLPTLEIDFLQHLVLICQLRGRHIVFHKASPVHFQHEISSHKLAYASTLFLFKEQTVCAKGFFLPHFQTVLTANPNYTQSCLPDSKGLKTFGLSHEWCWGIWGPKNKRSKAVKSSVIFIHMKMVKVPVTVTLQESGSWLLLHRAEAVCDAGGEEEAATPLQTLMWVAAAGCQPWAAPAEPQPVATQCSSFCACRNNTSVLPIHRGQVVAATQLNPQDVGGGTCPKGHVAVAFLPGQREHTQPVLAGGVGANGWLLHGPTWGTSKITNTAFSISTHRSVTDPSAHGQFTVLPSSPWLYIFTVSDQNFARVHENILSQGRKNNNSARGYVLGL